MFYSTCAFQDDDDVETEQKGDENRQKGLMTSVAGVLVGYEFIPYLSVYHYHLEKSHNTSITASSWYCSSYHHSL